MLEALITNKSFEEGSFTIKDPDYRLFKYLISHPQSRGRVSTHYETRAIPITVEDLSGLRLSQEHTPTLLNQAHVGIQIDNLPPNMNAILLGMISSVDESEEIYVKFEPFTWNPTDISFNGVRHTIGHVGTTVQSFYRKATGTNSPEGTHKEHLPQKVINRYQEKNLQACINWVLNQPENDTQKTPPQQPTEQELTEWGFVALMPYMHDVQKKAASLQSTEDNAGTLLEAIEAIDAFLSHLAAQYGDDLQYQKGCEVRLSTQPAHDLSNLKRSVTENPLPLPVITNYQANNLQATFQWIHNQLNNDEQVTETKIPAGPELEKWGFEELIPYVETVLTQAGDLPVTKDNAHTLSDAIGKIETFLQDIKALQNQPEYPPPLPTNNQTNGGATTFLDQVRSTAYGALNSYDVTGYFTGN